MKHYKAYIHRLKALFLVCLMILCTVTATAQTHDDHIMIDIGASYPKGLDFASYYIKYDKDPEAGYVTKHSFWKSYNMWTIGLVYKPCVVRGRNYHGNLRIGAGGGSDLHQAAGVGTLGYEHTFNLYNGWSVFFQVKEDVTLKGEDLFRTGATLGVKIPL